MASRRTFAATSGNMAMSSIEQRDRIVHELRRFADYATAIEEPHRGTARTAADMLASQQFGARDAVLAGNSAFDNLMALVLDPKKFKAAKDELVAMAERAAADAKAALDDRTAAEQAHDAAAEALTQANAKLAEHESAASIRAYEFSRAEASIAEKSKKLETDTASAVTAAAAREKRLVALEEAAKLREEQTKSALAQAEADALAAAKAKDEHEGLLAGAQRLVASRK